MTKAHQHPGDVECSFQCQAERFRIHWPNILSFTESLKPSVQQSYFSLSARGSSQKSAPSWVNNGKRFGLHPVRDCQGRSMVMKCVRCSKEKQARKTCQMSSFQTALGLDFTTTTAGFLSGRTRL